MEKCSNISTIKMFRIAPRSSIMVGEIVKYQSSQIAKIALKLDIMVGEILAPINSARYRNITTKEHL